ncbi:MAG: hypothetical protein ACK5L0_07350 [Candidatus Fimivivens sp.]
MLAHLALQNSAASAQLAEQQLYNAAALEGAAAMYLLTATLSDNVTRVVEQLARLVAFDEATSKNVGKMLPLLSEQGGGSALNDGANTAFGEVGAIGSLEDAGKAAKTAGGTLKGIKGMAGIVGMLGPLMGMIGPLMPFLLGGAAIAGIGGWVYSFFKKKDDKAEIKPAGPVLEQPTQAPAAQTTAVGQTQSAVPPNAAVDPFNTDAQEQSRYNAYQSQVDSSRQTADALRDAVETGTIGVVAKLEAVAGALERLANQPVDHRVNSEITIQSLYTQMTLSEFRDYFQKTVQYDLETVE